MSVYVDPEFDWPRTKKWPWGKASHMYADTEGELHEAAGKLGLRREWCSDHTHGKSHALLHYDLTPNKRVEAVKRKIAMEQSQEHMQNYVYRDINRRLVAKCKELAEELLDAQELIKKLKRRAKTRAK